MDNPKPPQQQIQIHLKEEIAEGLYANLALITHSQAEFVLDFVRVVPGTPKANVQARIIMTPMHTKALLRALEQNVAKYEAQNGEIRLLEAPHLANFPGSDLPN